MGLPHARGGVSDTDELIGTHYLSSPRPWGCFHEGTSNTGIDAVFPTPVGVFLNINLPIVDPESLPHARGGVSLVSDACQNLYRSSPRPWG